MFTIRSRRFGDFLDDMFENIGKDDFGWKTTTYYPKNETRVEDGFAIAEIDMPGLDKSDIDISVKENVMKVIGKKTVKEDDSEKVLRDYEYTYRLSDTHDTNNVSAEYTNGVLIIKVPVVEKEEDTKKIEVK